MKNTINALIKVLVLATAALGMQLSSAAKFTFLGDKTSPSLKIKGAIEEGDYLRFLNAIVADAERGGGFLLKSREIIIESPGGSVSDAILIARLIRRMNANVTAMFECSSACFIIFAGAADRVAFAPIRLHNPYLDQATADRLSPRQLENALSAGNAQMRQVLAEFGIPTALIERAVSRTSVEAHTLTPDDLFDIGRFSSVWNQIRVTKCQADSAYEREMERRFQTDVRSITKEQMDAYGRYRRAMKPCENSVMARDATQAVLDEWTRVGGK